MSAEAMRDVHAVHYSSGKDDWETPPDLFAALDAEFHFTLDVAANALNRKCEKYFGPDHKHESWRDALSLDWWLYRRTENVWLNPPYSRGLQGKFIAKAAAEARAGVTVVALLPARTDTKMFHEHIWDHSTHAPRPWVREVRFLPRRVKFVGADAGAPFPSMVVVFGNQGED